MRLAALSLAAALATGAAAAPAAAQTARCERGTPACTALEALLAQSAVAAAMTQIERDNGRRLAELRRLTVIAAPPFGEAARGRAFAALLVAAGADSVWTDAVGNVIALRRGVEGGRTLVFSGHLDTVFPGETDLTMRERGDTLFAPGVGDDTRGLVVVWAILDALERAGIETRDDILFVGTVGEEGLGDLRGVKHLFGAGGHRIDAFISVDGSDDGRIVHQALGSVRYRVTVRGPGGHSWGAFGLANPAHALGRAIREFDDAAARFTASGARTSYNVGRIGGGTSVNSIPFEAWMEVDLRSESQTRLASIDMVLRSAVERGVADENEARRTGDPLIVELEKVGDRPSGETPRDAPLVLAATAVTQHFGLDPALQRSSTDSNIPISRGIPAITIGGGGRSGNAHSLDEWWANMDEARGVQRALLIVLLEAGLARR